MTNIQFLVLALLMSTLAICGQASAANSGNAVATQVPKTTVTALPLKHGYYVASDTPCNQASNATVVLIRRDGIGGSRDFCEFKRIEKTGANTYRITQACTDFQSGDAPEISLITYTLQGDASFTSRSEHDWTHSARYCVQSSMPPEWHENDISDVINQ